MPEDCLSVECCKKINIINICSNRIFRDPEMEVAVKTFNVRVVLSLSIKIITSIATSSPKDACRSVNATSLGSTYHPIEFYTGHTNPPPANSPLSTCCTAIANATSAAFYFATIRTDTAAIINRLITIHTNDPFRLTQSTTPPIPIRTQ